MKRLRKVSSAFLFLALLQGCHRHKKKMAAIPPPPPEVGPVMVSVPPPTHPSEPIPESEPVAVLAPEPADPPKKTLHPHRTSTPSLTSPTLTPPVPFELGQLSAGGNEDASLQRETTSLIGNLTQRMIDIPAPLRTAHRRQISQARRFLNQAQASWKTGDVEGAHTLAVKAKVLLDDLPK